MFSAQVIVDTDVLEALREAAKNAPRTVDVFVNKTVKRDIGRRILDEMGQMPGSPRHPILWMESRHPEDIGKPPNTRYGYYSRQKAAYFATRGFGRGIPYTRTGGLVRAWRVDYESGRDTGLLTAINDAPAAPFVYGPYQQPFHANTGWPGMGDLDQIFLEISERATNMLIDGWYSIVEPGKGVRLI